jgi:hypothetical protein
MHSRYHLAVLLLTASLGAQAYVVSPAQFDKQEANASNAFPFGSNVITSQRYMQIQDDMAGSPRLLRGFEVRRDGPGATGHLAFQVACHVLCSTAATTSATADVTFDNNHGTDKAQVVTNRSYNIPAIDSGWLPAPWTYVFPFDTPFPFPGNGSLALEVKLISTTSQGNNQLDYANSAAGNTNPNLMVGRFGTGCVHSGRTAVLGANPTGAQVNWAAGTGIMRVTASGGPNAGTVVLLSGFSRTTAFGSIPLPHLIPNTNGYPSGDCFLYTDVTFVGLGVTNSNGSATIDTPVPVTPDLAGLTVHSQLLALDTNNAAGVITSNGVSHHWSAPFGPIMGARIWRSNDINAVTGSVNKSQQLVVKFNL